jgi:asparagine synthase (glutamine-hydrolysing)
MLWTTPESLQEHLPLQQSAGPLVLTADARIDNRAELISALDLTAYSRETLSDSALILHAYARWGENCPEKLLGDFAFVVWDEHRQRLFCARDHFGIKPFYYYHRPGQLFVCASEIKALLSLAAVPRRLNELRVAEYLVPIFEDKTITLYRDIHRLPAAHSLSTSREGIQLRRYWSLDPSRELRFGSDEEYSEGFHDIFTKAVRCRLRHAFPVGSMLSGGLDSSAIVGAARQALAEEGHPPLYTFSAIFPSLAEVDHRIDERSYMDVVLAMGGCEPHYVHADQVSPLAEILWRGDEAIPAPNLYMDCLLFNAAKQKGARILLSGWDGDSTVSHGYEYLEELARTGQWKTLLAEAGALSQRLANPYATPQRIVWEFGLRPLIPEWLARSWRMLRGRKDPPLTPIHAPVNAAFAKRIGLEDRIHALLDERSTPVQNAREEHYRCLNSGLLVYGLELLDKAAAASAVELRFPFCDRRLLEYCLALPPRQKLHEGYDRAVMRRAMAEALPQKVKERIHKGSLSVNFKRRLLENERETIERVIVDNAPIIEEYVDMPSLRAAYDRYAAAPLQREGDALTVFLAVTLALWLQQASLAL